MLGIREHEAAKPFGGLSSSRMLGAQALKQAGVPDGVWAPSPWLLSGGSPSTKAAPRWGPAGSHPATQTEAQGSASHFLGRTFFPISPVLDSFRAGACSLLIRAGKFGCTSGQLQGGGAQCPVPITSLSCFTQQPTGNEEQVVLTPLRFLADITGLCCLAQVLALLWESAGKWHWPTVPLLPGAAHHPPHTCQLSCHASRQRYPTPPVPSRNLGHWQLCL